MMRDLFYRSGYEADYTFDWTARMNAVSQHNMHHVVYVAYLTGLFVQGQTISSQKSGGDDEKVRDYMFSANFRLPILLKCVAAP